MRLRGCSNISTRSRQALIPCRIPDSAVRSDNAATACSGSGSSAPWCLRFSLISWPLHTARPVRTAPVARCDVMGMPALETSVAISSYACLTKADLDGFLPSPYNATSWSFTALTRTSVSSAVIRYWRAPGKFAIIIAMCHGTSAPAFKGNVRWRSGWFIAHYAQTTPMTNVVTSDQPILDLEATCTLRLILAFQIVKIEPILISGEGAWSLC